MGQEKTSTVISIGHNYQSYDKGGQKVYVHLIKMKNGDEGDYRGDQPVCDYFEEKKECAYEFSTYPKRFGSGVDVVFTKPKRAAVSSSSTKKGGGQQRNEAAISAQHAIGRSVELVCAGKLELKELFNKAQEILDWTSKTKPKE